MRQAEAADRAEVRARVAVAEADRRAEEMQALREMDEVAARQRIEERRATRDVAGQRLQEVRARLAPAEQRLAELIDRIGGR